MKMKLVTLSLFFLFFLVSITAQTGYLEVDPGVKIFYQKEGNGDKVVIVPLGFMLYEDFRILADDYTVVFYDMRNRGRSSLVKDSTLVSIQKDVEDLEKLRKHFDLEKISLVGESYLGMMVILYTMQYPQYVERIVQIGAVPYKYTNEYPKHLTNPEKPKLDTIVYNQILKLHQENYHETNPKEFSVMYWQNVGRYGLVADTSYINKMGPLLKNGAHLEYETEWFPNMSWHLKYHFGSVQQLDIDPKEIAKITQPVLTIHGTKDRNAPYGAGREWAKLLPNARLLTIKDAGHMPWIENPTLVFSSIKTFLNGIFPENAEKIKQ